METCKNCLEVLQITLKGISHHAYQTYVFLTCYQHNPFVELFITNMFLQRSILLEGRWFETRKANENFIFDRFTQITSIWHVECPQHGWNCTECKRHFPLPPSRMVKCNICATSSDLYIHKKLTFRFFCYSLMF